MLITLIKLQSYIYKKSFLPTCTSRMWQNALHTKKMQGNKDNLQNELQQYNILWQGFLWAFAQDKLHAYMQKLHSIDS